MTTKEIYQLIENGKSADAIKILNDLYRDGNTLISDGEYDKLLSDFKKSDPQNDIFKSGVIETVNPDRKEKLKFPMFSLDKESEISNIQKWLKNKGLPLTTLLVITAKYDGISILKDEYNQLAWSRGDGKIGETMENHYAKISDKYQKLDLFTIGEMIIPKSENPYANSNGNITDGLQTKQPAVINLVLQNGSKIAEYLIDDINNMLGVKAGLAGRGMA